MHKVLLAWFGAAAAGTAVAQECLGAERICALPQVGRRSVA